MLENGVHLEEFVAFDTRKTFVVELVMCILISNALQQRACLTAMFLIRNISPYNRKDEYVHFAVRSNRITQKTFDSLAGVITRYSPPQCNSV